MEYTNTYDYGCYDELGYDYGCYAELMEVISNETNNA